MMIRTMRLDSSPDRLQHKADSIINFPLSNVDFRLKKEYNSMKRLIMILF